VRALTVLLTAAAAATAQALENASFDDGLEGWTLEVGAQHGKPEPASTVEADREARASLRFAGDDATRVWRMVTQAVPCPAGHRVLLRVAGRCRGLVRASHQFRNANGVLLFRDAAGQRLGIVGTEVLEGDREWVDLVGHALAPEGTATVTVGVFSSMTGTAWFDDVRLEIAPAAATGPALAALRVHLERTYPFWGLDGKAKPEDLPVRADGEIVPALSAMLGPLRDVHVWIETPTGPVYTVGGNRPNGNDGAVRKALGEPLLDLHGHLVAPLGDLAYARIGNFQKGFDELEEAMDRLAGARAWILDLRWNGGGDEKLCQRIVRRFLEREIDYGTAQVRDATLPGLAGFGPRAPRRLAPDPGREPDRRKVVVLQGPCCVSSTEAFLCMMGRLDGVTTVGLPSRGSSGNPRPFLLAPGLRVWAPTTLYLTPAGEPIEGRGLAPMVRVEGPHDRGDPTLEKAVELLRR
jgi:hypothetical protein